MARLGLACKVFWRVLRSEDFARSVEPLVKGRPVEPPEAAAPAVESESLPGQSRGNDALTLLAVLQREARFVDFVQEPLSSFTDEQIGAAARDVQRGCAVVLERLFALQPVVQQAEGSPLEVPLATNAARFRLTGRLAGQPPYRGTLVHHGWEAVRCDLPAFNGGLDAARVIAPAEVEVA